MDYNQVLEEAYLNSSSSSGSKVRCLSTKFKPAKKDARTKILSENIKKFLQKQKEQEDRERKEAEKRLQTIEQKKQEARKLRKKESLAAANNVPNKKLAMNSSAIVEDTNNDDYGYTSQAASEFERKFLEKFQNIERSQPESIRLKSKKKSSTVSVSNPIESTTTTATTATTTTTTTTTSATATTTTKDKQIDTKTIKLARNIPSQMSFQDLLKLAEKKQHEPIIIQKKIVEERRPMTEKELKRYQEEMASVKRREQKWKEVEREFNERKKMAGNGQPVKNKVPVTGKQQMVPSSTSLSSKKPSVTTNARKTATEKKPEIKPLIVETKVPTKMQSMMKSVPKPVPKISTPIFAKQKRKQKVIYSDDEEEYDSDMDDFIVDDDCDVNVSDYIQKMFKYDRSKYENEDDEDDRNMESSFGQQQREEMISSKIGLLEDLEDIKKEKAEKLRKEKFKRRF